jgi:deazaflavin-dependent oxidoreductase (nitroreductase family)
LIQPQEGSSVPPAPDFNQRVIDEFRAGGGSVGGMFEGTPLILVTTAGRRTGRPRTSPVTYLMDGSRYLIFGSNLGRPRHPGWYHNLLASPQATIEVAGGDGSVKPLAARAVVLHGVERDRLYERQSTISPAFREYQEQTTRTIPVVALCPLDMSADTERGQLLGDQLIAHHNELRAALGRVRAQLTDPAADFTAQLREHCLSYCYGLELHHIREDGAFTAIEEPFPHLAPVISRLRSEHRVVAKTLAGLEALLTRGASGDARSVLAALDDAVAGLEDHFGREEEQLITALRRGRARG